MKLCVIAPVRHLEELAVGRMHLILAHWVLENAEYAKFYQQKVEEGHYVILDNGAHEKKVSDSIDDLIKAAKIVNPSEIVCCDAINDADETVDRTIEAFSRLSVAFPDTKLMVVPQGKNFADWLWCLQRLTALNFDCLGIPRVQADMEGTWMVHITAAMQMKVRKPIHLLGCPNDPNLIIQVNQLCGELIRSTDTAKPITYAKAGLIFPPTDPDIKISRPDDYLNLELTDRERLLAGYNIGLFAGGLPVIKSPLERIFNS